MIVKGITIQDLHFGHKRTEEMYSELKIVKDYLKENEVHILNINGDYFDRKLVGTEPAIFFAVNFFSELMDICREKGVKVRIIQGTRSHELNQLTTMFQHYLNDPKLDIRIILTIEKEDLMGTKVLYMPEEYPENGIEYYQEYMKDEYNVIHGHGTWDFVSFIANDSYEENTKMGIHSAPVFKYDDWRESVKNGLAIFGHIHKRQHHKNIYYSGSFTSWGYGDRSEKGFTAYEIDTETNKWKFKYVNNEKAPRYDVISIRDLFKEGDLEKMATEDIQRILNEEVLKTDNLRIDLAGLTKDKIEILRKSFSGNSKVKIEVKEKKAMLKESTEPAIYDRYGYILKRELPLDETVKRFMQEDYKVEMTLEKIKELISENE
jgi:hypothetical protein